MPLKQQTERRSIPARDLRVATADDGSKTIGGYFSVFNSPSVDMGGWYEMVSPTAFTRSLQEQPDVLCLYSHDTSAVLGRTTSGTLTLAVDPTGLKFTCKLPDTSVARDLATLMERGDINACSFGFYTQSDVWSQDSAGNTVRTLLDVTLIEGTICAEPAYPDTSAALRTAPKEVRAKLAKSDPIIACGCSCEECSIGNCDDCSDSDCDDELCSCEAKSNRSWQDVTLRLDIAARHTFDATA